MVLNSLLFVTYLALVCVVAYICPRRWRYLFLLAASYGFYLYNTKGWVSQLPALGLLLVSTFVSYLATLGVAKFVSLPAKRFCLGIGIGTGLLLLFLCKYYNFFSTALSATGLHTPSLQIVLPLGISYYTLQAVSYSMDVYYGRCPVERNPLRYALYLSFFPGIVTGPINRAGNMLPQYQNPPKFDYNKVSGGLFRVLWGIFKKMVIADTIGVFTAQVFARPSGFGGPMLLAGALLFAYQLYTDFGGCCDIAIGAAQMLGFTFAENFNRPFAAKTFTTFWQRWHMSLTSFFRDYVLEPLVWSRWTEKLPFIGKHFTKPPVTSAVLIIYTLSGLWHGADWGYILWGVITGLLMIAAKWLAKPKEKLVKKIPVYRNRHVRGFVQRILVYLLFALTLVFFAGALYGGGVWPWFAGLLQGWQGLTPANFMALLTFNDLPRDTLLVLLFSIVLVEIVEMLGIRKGSTVATWVRKRAFWVRWPLYYVLLGGLLAFGVFGQSVFIYQQY